MQNISVAKKPKFFCWNLWPMNLWTMHGRLILYIVARLFYALRWKNNEIPTMEK